LGLDGTVLWSTTTAKGSLSSRGFGLFHRRLRSGQLRLSLSLGSLFLHQGGLGLDNRSVIFKASNILALGPILPIRLVANPMRR
jgi:hypothetical protein